MKFLYIYNDLSDKNDELKKIIEGIHHRYLKSDKLILEALTKVSFILYLKKDLVNSLIITDKLSGIIFNNDYDYWTWIEYALCLRAEIAINFSENDKARDSINKINYALNYGEGFQKKIRMNVHKRFMDGEGIELNDSVFSDDDLSIYEEFNYRLIYQMSLIKLKVLGGSEEYKIEKALININSNADAINNLINKGALEKAQPFK